MVKMRRLFVFVIVAMVALENRVDAQRGFRDLAHQRELKRRFGRYTGKRDSGKTRDNDGRRNDKGKEMEKEKDRTREKGSADREQKPAREPSKESSKAIAPVAPKGSKRPQNSNSGSLSKKGEVNSKPPPNNAGAAKKKHRTRQSKKQMEKISKKSKSNSSSDGKGKGKGGGGGSGSSGDDDAVVQDDDITDDDGGIPTPGCRSSLANALRDIVPEVITVNPPQCCNYKGPIGVYVTHALPSPNTNTNTNSGFEPFWDAIYTQIATTSEHSDACFVMTGYEPSSRSPSDILTDVTVLASSLPDVVAMMVSDPTSEQQLINEIRFITKDPALPSIGVFNAGYNNIVTESLVSGEQMIPYVGVTNDADFGIKAAQFSKDALDGKVAKPLCFNGRTELEFVGERCVAYYSELGQDSIRPIIGVSCSEDSPVEELFNMLVEAEANVVFSTINCCSVVSSAAAMARSMGQSIVAVGCQEEDTTNGEIDFVTAQPVQIQGHTPASWVIFPVLQAQSGQRGRQFFPSLDSIVHTDIFTIPIQ